MNKPESAEHRIFQEIAKRETASIPRLARELGIQPQSLLGKLRPLVKKEVLILSDGRAKVEINPDFGQVVGIDLGGSHLHFALADFRGKILQDSTVKIRPEDGPRKLIGEIVEGARALAAEARADAFWPSPLASQALSMRSAAWWRLPTICRDGKTSIWGANSKHKLRVPMFLENDCNMAAIGEHWRGVAKGVDNFVMIAIGTGTGSGVFVDGKLYRGRTGSAGEVYHMNIDWSALGR